MDYLLPATVYQRQPLKTIIEDNEDSRCSSRGSYAGSVAETVFSESCPSLAESRLSVATSIATDSSCNSVVGRNGINRFPALFIPRGTWQEENKAQSLGIFTPSAKLMLSPETLQRLSLDIPSADFPPSLGDASSIRSESPCLPSTTNAPPTPNMRDINISGEHPWETLATPLEIALDDENSILLSAEEAHSNRAASSNYMDMMHSFPLVPGLTPIDTPVTPSVPRALALANLTGESGVQLPAQALAMLNSLSNEQYAESVTGSSVSAVEEEEMQECSVPLTRPYTWCNDSPRSEYSISQLSIPSPGAFFSSLQSGSRNTWCSPTRKTASPPPPSSTTAENFYKAPWAQSPKLKETILEYDDDAATDGPPTVKQSTFSISAQEPSYRHEYEEAYEEGLKHAAGANIDRTSDWLSAQSNLLSVLRESASADDLASSDASTRVQSVTQERRKAARTLQRARAASSPKEATFLQAFTYQESESKSSDVFLHASSRLDSVQSTRIATPKSHVMSLLNTHTSKTLEPAHARPKYRGPFAQNPRNTQEINSENDQAEFQTLERQQTAMNAIKPNIWSLEAQRTILYNGRLMANRVASEQLTQIDAKLQEPKPSTKRRPRVLDLAGAATASWAWAAAAKWPNAQVVTVQTNQQAELSRSYAAIKDQECDMPQTPTNHKVVSVPHLWDMPFRDNYFDVISARTLHMYLRANPVPSVESIDEWDMTLKECMRVLKPGGILDFFVMDSGISNGDHTDASDINLSPTGMTACDTEQVDIINEFKSELQRRGYESDGGCGRLMSRLKQEGFVGVRRQWIGLPMGRADNKSATFRQAPRPISEVSDIARIVDQYTDVEAVQGPVGSTDAVADMSALLGELLWEEWLVRLRIESGNYTPDTILNGVDEQFGKWRRSGNAAWRGVLGWARKPSKKDLRAVEEALATNHVAPLYNPSQEYEHGLVFKPATLSAPAGIQRTASVRRSGLKSPSSAGAGLTICTNFDNKSAISRVRRTHRRESGEIPMMIIG